MKTLLYYLIIGIFLSLSCKKDPLDYIYSGTIIGLHLNNNNWPIPQNWKSVAFGGISPSTVNCKGGLGFITIQSSTPENFGRELISMFGLPLKTGKVIVTEFIVTDTTSKCIMSPGANIYLDAEDGDILVGTYTPLPSAENSVTIISYNANSGDVSGTFDITFVKKDLVSFVYPYYTDTIRFNGGQFHTKWIK